MAVISESDFHMDLRPGLVDAGRKIEEESFRIIDAEMGPHDFTAEQWQIVRRVIHTTGDFDYSRWIRFSPGAIEAGIEFLQKGAPILTDTRMIQTGLSPWRLNYFGNEVVTPAAKAESQRWAEEMGTTRSVAAFRRYSRQIDGGIVAIGNAPTALLEVVRLIQEEATKPALVIGVPVGFVQAAESKDELLRLKNLPAIVIQGRKGGSTVAIAILHALLELARTMAPK
jgi:precorrin-8X/cobalt-precorrin-8 methylmutase